VRVIEPTLTMSEQLLLNLRSSLVKVLRAAGAGGRAPGAAVPGAAAALGPDGAFGPLAGELLRWQRLTAARNRMLAYCFCTVE